MKRPVLGTIAILILLCGGLYVGYTLQDRAPDRAVSRTFADNGARAFMDKSLRIIPPSEARDLSAAEESAGQSYSVLARFDLPPQELDSLLKQNDAFPTAVELKDDPAVLQSVIALGDAAKRPWWQPEQLQGAHCAQRTSRRKQGTGFVKSIRYLCAGPGDAGYTRIYVALVEEPEGK
jgi:hypothetical protein